MKDNDIRANRNCAWHQICSKVWQPFCNQSAHSCTLWLATYTVWHSFWCICGVPCYPTIAYKYSAPSEGLRTNKSCRPCQPVRHRYCILIRNVHQHHRCSGWWSWECFEVSRLSPELCKAVLWYGTATTWYRSPRDLSRLPSYQQPVLTIGKLLTLVPNVQS